MPMRALFYLYLFPDLIIELKIFTKIKFQFAVFQVISVYTGFPVLMLLAGTLIDGKPK
jgi:hypothetical protein